MGIGGRCEREVKEVRVQSRETREREPQQRQSNREGKKEIGEIDTIRGHVARKGPKRLDSPRWKSWLARASTVALLCETRYTSSDLRLEEKRKTERQRYHLPLLKRWVNLKNQLVVKKAVDPSLCGEI